MKCLRCSFDNPGVFRFCGNCGLKLTTSCPSCGCENPSWAKFCNNCGSSLSLLCPNCNCENPGWAKFCNNCGVAIATELAIARSRAEDRPSQPSSPISAEPAAPNPSLYQAPLQSVQAKAKLDRESEDEKLSRLQQYVPEYLRDKILATKGRIEGERKVVTILFSDISGFTSLSEKFADDPEEVSIIIDNCHKALGKVIYKYEGVIDKIVGDGIMALFGAPITHENDPERAVLAALEMMEEMKKLNLEFSKQLEIPPLSIHIGINTGMVVVGNIGTDLRLDYTVMGDAVNLASRLESISESNQIIVSHNTYRLSKSFFDFKELEPTTVQGKTDPIQIYEVVDRRKKRLEERGIEGLETVMIGRKSEFQTLKRCGDDLTESKKGQVISLIGEAGLGKSRLKREFKKYLGDRVSWVDGRCLSHIQNVAYSIFLDVLREYLKITEFSEESEVKEKLFEKVRQLVSGREEGEFSPENEIVPYIGNLLSVKFEGELGDKIKYLDAQQLQRRTLMAVRDLFSLEAERRPLVLALDDLHWVDDLSLNLISFLIESISDLPIMLLCAYRPEKRDACWKIGDIAVHNLPYGYSEVILNRFSPEESEFLLDSIIKIDVPELKQLILKKSEGTPFYLEEVVRALIENGVLVKGDDDQWKVTRSVEDIAVPSTVEGVIMARIDRLQDESKYVLQRASVIGKTFQSSVLAYMCRDIPGFKEYLDRLTELDLIREVKHDPDPEYVFRHILTREIAYKNIIGPRRREFHEQVGDGIEEIYSKKLNDFVEILSYHYSESNNLDKAVNYLVKSGHKARMLYDNANTIRFYEQCLDKFGRLKTPRPDLQMEVYEGLGDVYQLIGKYDEAINSYRILIEKEGDFTALARASRKLGEVYEKIAKYDQALENFSSGLELLGDSDESFEHAMLLNDVGWVYFRKSDYQKALEHCEKALKIALKSEEYNTIANIYNRLGAICGSSGKGEVNLALEYQRQALGIRKKMGDLQGEADSYNVLGLDYMMSGKLDEALECFSKSMELKTKIGEIQGIAIAWGNMATIYFRLGDYDKAVEGQQKSIEINERIGNLNNAATAYSNLGNVYHKKGELEKAMECYEKSMNIFDQIGATSNAAICAYNIGDTYCDRGELDKAQSFLEKALERFQKVGHAIGIARAYNSLGKNSYKFGNTEKAIEYYKNGMDISEKSNDIRGRGLAYYEMGNAYAKLNDINLANDYLSKALEVFEGLKSTPDVKKVKDAIADIEALSGKQ